MSYNVSLIVPDSRAGRPPLTIPVPRPAASYAMGDVVVIRDDAYDAGGDVFQITGPGYHDPATRELRYPAAKISMNDVPEGMVKLFRRR